MDVRKIAPWSWQGDNCAVGSSGSRGPGKGLAEGGQCGFWSWESVVLGTQCPMRGLEGLSFQILSPADSPASTLRGACQRDPPASHSQMAEVYLFCWNVYLPWLSRYVTFLPHWLALPAKTTCLDLLD